MNDLEQLLSASAVRKRCHQIYQAALSDSTPHFELHSDQTIPCADFVLEIIKRNYPDLDIPYHSRWRHFVVDGVDYWRQFKQENLSELDDEEQTRIAIDLVFVSVLLDAGAGNQWRYVDKRSGKALTRSEGLAIASFDMFCEGYFSSSKKQPYRVDTEVLLALSEQELEKGFQSSADNQLVGISGRLEILRGLGKQLERLAGNARPSVLFDALKQKTREKNLSVESILHEVLQSFNAMWPSGLMIDGVALGDTGKHSLIKTEDKTSGLIPFHKLSQWLTYSIVEPLEWAGLNITGMDNLTGLPEYRNGGLLLDLGVLTPRDKTTLERKLSVGSEPVTEWRALTVALLDIIAMHIRESLNKTRVDLPLAKILQGGTWAAGREIAKQNRADGSPPIRLAIDGTIF